MFLDLLREMDGQNRPVSSSSRASTYAPRLFEALPAEQRCGFRRADFEKAMNALFRDRKSRTSPTAERATSGPGSPSAALLKSLNGDDLV